MNISSSKEILNKCSTCVLGQFCLPLGLSANEVTQVDTLVKDRVHLHKGDTLYRHGEPLNAIYSVRFGTLKTEHSVGQVYKQEYLHYLSLGRTDAVLLILLG